MNKLTYNKLKMNELKQFIIGSSIIITAPFLYMFNKINNKGLSYFNYSILAPLWFGTWNIISFYMAKQFNLSLKQRFLIISLISYLCVVSYARLSKSYNFTSNEWTYYYLGQLVFYFFVWNIVIYFLTISF